MCQIESSRPTALDVARFVGQQRACRMDALTGGLKDSRHRVLRKPVDLDVGVRLAQLVRDGDVALRVAEPDGRGDVERALATGLPTRPAMRWGRRLGEVPEKEVELDRIAQVRCMAGAFEHHQPTARVLGERHPAGQVGHPVAVPVYDQNRAPDA